MYLTGVICWLSDWHYIGNIDRIKLVIDVGI